MDPDVEVGVIRGEKGEGSANSTEVKEEVTTLKPQAEHTTRILPERSIHDVGPVELFEILRQDTKTQLLGPGNAASNISQGSDTIHGERWEESIGFLHFKNVLYTRAKVLKHDVVLRAMSVPNEVKNESRAERAEIFQAIYSPDILDTIRDDLAHYSTALKNYRDWSKNWKDMVGAEYNGLPEQLAAFECGSHHELWNKEELSSAWKNVLSHYERPGLPSHQHLAITKTFKAQDNRSKFVSRLTMALFGGAALIAPMLIMTLHPTQLTTLLTTSVFVFVVAGILAWLMEDAEGKDIVGATAAYAAVLVVFVGTGGGSSG